MNLLARWVGESPFVRVLHCYVEQASGLVTREPEPLFVQLGLWNLPHFKQFENGRFDVEIAEKCTCISATVILPHVDCHWRCPFFFFQFSSSVGALLEICLFFVPKISGECNVFFVC